MEKSREKLSKCSKLLATLKGLSYSVYRIILNKCKKVIESYEYIDSEDVLCLA